MSLAAVIPIQGPTETHSERLISHALRAIDRGKPLEALALAEGAVRKSPGHFDSVHLLGFVYREIGEPEMAIQYLLRAVDLDPEDCGALSHLGGAYSDVGLNAESERILTRALHLQPGHANALCSLGVTYLRCARVEEAKHTFMRAIQGDPGDPTAYFELAGLLYRDGLPALAIEALEAAMAARPGHGPSLFQLAMIAFRLGDVHGANALLASVPGMPKSYLTSWEYVRAHAADAIMFGNTWDTLEHGIDSCTVNGPILEFRVHRDASLEFISDRFAGSIHAFDDFQAPPEDWGVATPGAFFGAPHRLRMHEGPFADTVPRFAMDLSAPIRMLHIDCDLYNSTGLIFDTLAEHIVPGTVIVFDQYFINATWKDDEHKTFREAVAKNGWSYEYLGYSFFSRQAVVRITG